MPGPTPPPAVGLCTHTLLPRHSPPRRRRVYPSPSTLARLGDGLEGQDDSQGLKCAWVFCLPLLSSNDPPSEEPALGGPRSTGRTETCGADLSPAPAWGGCGASPTAGWKQETLSSWRCSTMFKDSVALGRGFTAPSLVLTGCHGWRGVSQDIHLLGICTRDPNRRKGLGRCN